MENKVTKSTIYLFLIYLFFLIFFIGIMVSYFDNVLSIEWNDMEFFVSAFLFMIMYVIADFVQVIIHELGHLIFGLMSGYKFASFRVLNVIFFRKNNKFYLKKFHMAGTAGQCLMEPPEMVDGKIPYLLYNLGGIILNFISVIIFLILYWIFFDVTIVSTLILLFILMGIFYVLLNGIPLQMKMINNDGYNIISIRNNEESMRGLWLQLKCNSLLLQDKGLKDAPKEWFKIPDEKKMIDGLSSSIAVFACNRLIEEHKFKEANKKIKKLLDSNVPIVGIYRNLLLCDCIFCELITDNKANNIDSLMDQELLNFMKKMKDYPSILRVKYAYALLYQKDIEEAEEFKYIFEEVAKKYPYSIEIENEKKLLKLVDSKYSKKKK